MNNLGPVQNFGSNLMLNQMESAGQNFPSRILAPKPVDSWWQFIKTFEQLQLVDFTISLNKIKETA